MAHVFAAVHPRTGAERAIKVMLLPTEAARARFMREARVQSRVDHDNVLRVLDVIQLGGTPPSCCPSSPGRASRG